MKRSLIEKAPSARDLQLLSRADYQLSRKALAAGDTAMARESLASAVCNAMIAYRVTAPEEALRRPNPPSVIEVWSSIQRSRWWK